MAAAAERSWVERIVTCKNLLVLKSSSRFLSKFSVETACD